MKKIVFLTAIVGTTLAMCSFRTATAAKANFDVVTSVDDVDDGGSGSFTSSYEKGTDPLTTWEKWHKTWSLTSTKDAKDISKMLSRF